MILTLFFENVQIVPTLYSIHSNREEGPYKVCYKCKNEIARKLVMNKVNPKITSFIRKNTLGARLDVYRLIYRGSKDKFVTKKF